MILILSVAVIALLETSVVKADLPINCTYADAHGQWVFHVGEEGHDNTINCTEDFRNDSNNIKYAFTVDLQYPDVAIDGEGNVGFWTMMYNEGFEVVVGGKKFYAPFKYEVYEKQSISTNYCDKTSVGWAHDIDGSNWACYVAMKTTEIPARNISSVFSWIKSQSSAPFAEEDSDLALAYVNHINRAQNTWSAKTYPEFASRTMSHMTGGAHMQSAATTRPPATVEELEEAEDLPENFDWRSVNGVNYVPPVRDQGRCGACYAFAALAMTESRFRIMTNNTYKPILSPQDIVECSQYSQACSGGFIYLIGGKYGEDFGFVDEKCSKYKFGTTSHGKCSTSKSCSRRYTTGYEYIGGYYGATNEVNMRLNLFKYGPITVDLQIYRDFMSYKSGIYRHTKSLPGGIQFDPYESISHAVMIVGYGTDRTDPENPIDYWIVRNSWGPTWGENGYFRIARGINECSIESAAVQSFPILDSDI